MNLVIFNKPYRVLSQFSQGDIAGRRTLGNYITDCPGFYPAGRLDYQSEGLLLLTNDGRLQDQIANADKKMPKTYLVQLSEPVTNQGLDALRSGLVLKDGPCRPAKVQPVSSPVLWTRIPPVAKHRSEKSVWLSITITEGRNRQVRRMLASVGSPVIRLVRIQVGHWKLDDLQPGKYRLDNVHLPVQKHRSTRSRHGRNSNN